MLAVLMAILPGLALMLGAVVLTACGATAEPEPKQPPAPVETPEYVADAVSSTGGWVEVSAAGGHSCGLKENGKILCWGSNFHGESSPPPELFRRVRASNQYTCGLTVGDEIRCWGTADMGVIDPPAGTFAELTAGYLSACALDYDGELHCWGAGWEDAGYADQAPPGPWVQVDGDDRHACAVDAAGALACWGFGFDEFGDNWDLPKGTYQAVAAGNTYNCAIRLTGYLDCWGWGLGGASKPSGQIRAVDTDFTFACALDKKTALCWAPSFDEFGFPATPIPTPATTPPSVKFDQIDTGPFHACGVDVDGFVHCWGDANWGRATPP